MTALKSWLEEVTALGAEMFDSSVYTAPACEVIDIQKGDEEPAWEKIQAAVGGTLTDRGVEILRSGLDGHVSTVFVEPRYVCKDYRNLFSHFYSKKFCGRDSHCYRLHFFTKPSLRIEDVIFRPETCRDYYVGYTVIEPVAGPSLGRTLIDPLKLGRKPEEFFCLRTRSKIRIQGTEYVVFGFPYRSQTAEAVVCAHAALWSACRYLSERYRTYREVYPYDLIEMVGDTEGRRVPYRSMTWTDYSTVFVKFGCHPAIIRPRNTERAGRKEWWHDPDAFYNFYAYIESGFPILTSFGGHVVNVIGHTLSDTIQPKHDKSDAGYYNSAAFVKEYIVVDDNFFPYQLLGYRDAPQYYKKKHYDEMKHPPSIDSIYAAVVPIAEKAFLLPFDHRKKADEFLQTGDIQKLVTETIQKLGCEGQPLIARQFLTTASAFKGRKRDYWTSKQTDQRSTFPITLNLPHFIWVTELSAKDLFNQRQCFGEIVVDATLGKLEWEPIYTRIGQYLVLNHKDEPDLASSLCYPQFTHNLGHV